MHAYIIHYLKKQMPYVIGKSEKQKKLLDRLDRCRAVPHLTKHISPSLPPSFLPSFLPSILPSFLYSFHPSFPPSILPSFPTCLLSCLRFLFWSHHRIINIFKWLPTPSTSPLHCLKYKPSGNSWHVLDGTICPWGIFLTWISTGKCWER